MRPRLLDLFCGAGGAARGYQLAGFYVVGVDISPQPRYAGDEFILADALDPPVFYDELDAIHASPPCQAYGDLQKQSKREYPDLIAPTRELLVASGLPYVIENVEGAPLQNPITLCGSSFDLDVRRHRLFECSFPVMALPCAHNRPKKFETYRHGKVIATASVPVYGTGGGKAAEHWADAMGIDWMDRAGLAQAIPPAYSEHIGGYLLAELEARAVA